MKAAGSAASQASTATYDSWLKRYQPVSGAFDELLGSDGSPRAPWGRFIEGLKQIPSSVLRQRWEQARQLIRENGVTYNVYGDPKGLDRPWDLDPLPVVLGASEWNALEKGLVQRASLFDALLRDLYGPQRMIAEGGLPPELIFANPRFLPPCHGLPPAAGRYLNFYAADVARAPDGRWWVLADRTQAPSGAGYALENRIVITRMIPEVARACHLVRLADFFEQTKETLALASPNPREQPRIILLTPGPHNETYFEHAYLARYLGITLARGEDLSVRDDRVYLKTIDGLQPVDVIWRRVDDRLCDPLELRSESRLGVAGLLGAIRAGNVAVVNAPGAGLVETPAMMAFLPGLSRRLLGEELRLPSIATWWCGDEDTREMVVGKLDHLVLKHAFHKEEFGTQFMSKTSPEDHAALLKRIQRDPLRMVGQEEMRYSQSPGWADSGVAPRSIVLRVFLVATPDGYVAMPGGMTRVTTADQDSPGVSMQHGSGSKDTWILSDEELPPHRGRHLERYPIKIRRAASLVPSRVADNLYWIGRYAERAEFATRLLRQVVSRLTSAAGMGAFPRVEPLWNLLSEFEHLPPGEEGAEPTPTTLGEASDLLLSSIFDLELTGSLANTNRTLRRLASESRDSLSLDTWRIVRRLGGLLDEPDPATQLGDVLSVLNDGITLYAALSGMSEENITCSPGWRFLMLGRRLARSRYTCALAHFLLQNRACNTGPVLESVLEVIDSSITYRLRYLFEPMLLPVLDTLLLDSSNPRSLAFQLQGMDEHLAALPSELAAPFSTPARRLVTSRLAQVRTTDLNAADFPEELEKRKLIVSILTELSTDLQSIADNLTADYFSLLTLEHSAPDGPLLPGFR